jgi:16S rRNA (uracil1498-N3)-methyltransferase
MTRRRWIADEVSGNRAALVGPHAQHLARVLRAEMGQSFDLITGDGVRHGHIVSVHDDRVEFELGEEVTSSALPSLALLLAIFKFDRLEWAIEKCTELGVQRILPVIAHRTDAHLAAAAAKRVERWRRIIQQASQQSRRASVPQICEPLRLKDALGEQAAHRIVLSEAERALSLRDAVQSHPDGESVLLAIGPEGGWTEEELTLFAENAWIAASLGETILRAETAAIAATAIALSAMS